MEFPIFIGDQSFKQPPEKPVDLPSSKHAERILPENYIASPDLRDAVNVALLLGKPLLLTGEPGTGKTLLAYRIAWELGFDPPLKFETKSATVARDLFYYYNSLARFHDAQLNKEKPLKDPKDQPARTDGVEYISYNALGTAILRTKDEATYAPYLPTGFEHSGARRSIVLIDEIDKAARDFPNDILNELDQLYFRIPELGNQQIEADRSLSPVVIITSNSEKSLPDAFLRRCIFHHIEFPKRPHLEEIVATSLGNLQANDPKLSFQDQMIGQAISLFLELRESKHRFRKPPATSELLLWIETMGRSFPTVDNPLLEVEEERIVRLALNNLVKNQEDLKTAPKIILDWLRQQKT